MQCRRRGARASDAGAARRIHDSRKEGTHRRIERHDPRRHFVLARRAVKHLVVDQTWRARHAGWTVNTRAAGVRGVRLAM